MKSFDIECREASGILGAAKVGHEAIVRMFHDEFAARDAVSAVVAKFSVVKYLLKHPKSNGGGGTGSCVTE